MADYFKSVSRAIKITSGTEARFWRNVDRKAQNECWPWLGGRHVQGYGILREGDGSRLQGDRSVRAHRLALQLSGVDIVGKLVLHRCDNPPCCNPTHLYVGTPKRNVRDAIQRDRHYWPTAKILSRRQERIITSRYLAGERVALLAIEYGVGLMTIRRAIYRCR